MEERWRIITNPPGLLKFNIRDKDNRDHFYFVEKSLFGAIPLSVIIYIFNASPSHVSIEYLSSKGKEVKPSPSFDKKSNDFICIKNCHNITVNPNIILNTLNQALNELIVGGKYFCVISKVIAHLRDSVFIKKM